ncbi:hypothetical protein [Roseibium aestuarii]|uniref:Uncharacterized protein n=1 Tax=Roseibium aestuarii TaxID=2600299 RepID=A0ABW4JY43_9HYPH|nr:hypothetical protein [Roseibium aestuarii]
MSRQLATRPDMAQTTPFQNVADRAAARPSLVLLKREQETLGAEASSGNTTSSVADDDLPAARSINRWATPTQTTRFGRTRRQKTQADIAEARKLIVAIGLGLLMAIGLTFAAAWGPESPVSRTSSPAMLTPQVLEQHTPT